MYFFQGALIRSAARNGFDIEDLKDMVTGMRNEFQSNRVDILLRIGRLATFEDRDLLPIVDLSSGSLPSLFSKSDSYIQMLKLIAEVCPWACSIPWDKAKPCWRVHPKALLCPPSKTERADHLYISPCVYLALKFNFQFCL